MAEISCGFILYTMNNGVPYYLLIRDRKSGSYSFPKGHMEAGESELETALRETWEETSVRPAVTSGYREEISYKLKNGRRKRVIYFLGDFGSQTPRHNKGFESFDYITVNYAEAMARLTFGDTKTLLEKADMLVTGL